MHVCFLQLQEPCSRASWAPCPLQQQTALPGSVPVPRAPCCLRLGTPKPAASRATPPLSPQGTADKVQHCTLKLLYFEQWPAIQYKSCYHPMDAEDSWSLFADLFHPSCAQSALPATNVPTQCQMRCTHLLVAHNGSGIVLQALAIAPGNFAHMITFLQGGERSG